MIPQEPGNQGMTPRYSEDFAAGQTFVTSWRIRVEAKRVKAFAAEFDPQPFHLDGGAAKGSVFGRIVPRRPR